MYLVDDEYLNKNKRNIESDNEMYELLRQSFPGLELAPIKGSYRTSSLCLLVYLGYCASCYELSYFFGPYYASAPIRTRLAELSAKGNGTLATLAFSNNDMSAQKAYHITKQGYVFHLSDMPEQIKPQGGGIKIRRSGGLVPGHDYGVGISLYSFLLTGIPFYFEKEETYSFKSHGKTRGGVCVDCTLYLKGDFPYRMYLEQDMGTETALTLVNKIGAYKRLGLADASSAILFSSHSAMPMPSCVSFSALAVEEIIQQMKKAGIRSLYEFYRQQATSLNGQDLTLVKKLLVRTGVCDAYENGGALMAEYVSAGSELKRHLLNGVSGSSLSDDFTLEDLIRYASDLSSGCNPYRIREYNREQYRINKQKYRNMCFLLGRYVSNGNFSRDELLCLFRGYPCYVLPSVLLSNALPVFHPFDRTFWSSCLFALRAYYEGIDKVPCTELSEPFYFEDYPSVVLRNACALPDGRRVCLEHIGKDVGGFIRCMYLLQIAKELPELNLHIVAVCDNVDDMIYFCKTTGYMMKYSRFPLSPSFYISFLMESDLTKKEVFLKGIDSLEAPVAIEIRTKAQSESLLGQVHEGQENESMRLSDFFV